MTSQFQCWHCGATINATLPLSRREVCAACNADQHVCRMCQYYDAHVSDQCREDRAETVTDKERANFCDYFSPNPNAYKNTDNQKQNAARAKLDALFGNGEFGDGDTNKTEPATSPQDKNEAARKALEDLFNPPDKK